jgi:hypothetical protein
MPICNDFEKNFCWRIDELCKLLKSDNPLDKLKISATLRLLLLEDLTHQANRRFKLSIRFTTVYSNPPLNPQIDLWSILDDLYPFFPPPRTPELHSIELDLRRFLGKPVMKIKGREITVKDIIKFEANVRGGVHVRKANKSDKEQLMDEKLVEVVDERVTLHQLRTIGLVVLDALTPLYEALTNGKITENALSISKKRKVIVSDIIFARGAAAEIFRSEKK